MRVTCHSTREFLGLAARIIRRELLDLARHYYGPLGLGANDAIPAAGVPGRAEEYAPGGEDDPAELAAFTELHLRIAALPADEGEVFDLTWYHGLTQKEVAAQIGVSVKTVRLRWVAARLRLARGLGGPVPEIAAD